MNKYIGYSLSIFGVIVITFFRRYDGEVIPYPWVFWIIGFGFIFYGGLLVSKDLRSRKENQIGKLKEEIRQFSFRSTKITVHFKNCEIKEISQLEKRNITTKDPLFSSLDFERKMEVINTIDSHNSGTMCGSVIVFASERNGKLEKYITRLLPFDKMQLHYLLAKKKETTLFVDNQKRQNYYFDLDFLENNIEEKL